ncbi:two-component system response regulator, partial [Candidatus Riflebacteria bacterium]
MRKLDPRILSSFDGFDGLKTIIDFNPDVIILDIAMPGVNGIELLAQMEGNKEFEIIPILLVTAMPGKLFKDEVPEEIPFLIKPFDPDFLVDRIEELIEKRIKPLE